jgi:methionyl-tRNA formyltransferase
MRLFFCGTPEFAVPILERLSAEEFVIDLVVTNPDEPSGRGYALKAPPVKQAALDGGLDVFQPATLKDPATVAFLSRYRPDAIVVVAYGHLIPKWLIDLPRWGCINLHASLLPKYRGAAPIHWALMRGETVTGVTTMRIDAGLDTGDILLKREVGIQDDDTTETLGARLSLLGADLMVETLRSLERGDLHPQPQDHTQATHAPSLKKEDGRIDWALPAEEIWNRIRGLRPWPGAYTTFRGKNLHVWAAARPVAAETCPLEPRTLLADGGRLRVTCGQGTLLELAEVQLEGRKRLPARDFLNGVKILSGEKVE